MINIVSDAIAKWLEMEGAVSNEDRPLYAYAVYSFLFGLLPIGIMLLLGLCFGMIQEGLVLIIPFMMLRKFCGGFHLKSPGICFVTTVGVLAFSPVLPKITAEGSAFKPAFEQILPALFGALGASYFAKHWKLVFAPVIVGVIVLLFAPGMGVGTLMFITIVAAVAVALLLYKKNWL